MGPNTNLLAHTNYTTQSLDRTQDPRGPKLKSRCKLHIMEWFTLHVSWSWNAQNHSGILLDCLICPRNSVKLCMQSHDIHARPKLVRTSLGLLHQLTLEWRKEFWSNNHIPRNFWFCSDEMNQCMKGSKKKWMLDWPNIPSTWLVNVGTNLSREEVFALEDITF